MSLRKKDVYSKLSDCGRKVLGKSCLSKQTILSDKSCSPEQTILSVKSRSKRPKSFNFVECGLAFKDCHTPPNSPNYKCIENDILIKTIEEPYPILETKTEVKIDSKEIIHKSDPDRTSFQICKIM